MQEAVAPPAARPRFPSRSPSAARIAASRASFADAQLAGPARGTVRHRTAPHGAERRPHRVEGGRASRSSTPRCCSTPMSTTGRSPRPPRRRLRRSTSDRRAPLDVGRGGDAMTPRGTRGARAQAEDLRPRRRRSFSSRCSRSSCRSCSAARRRRKRPRRPAPCSRTPVAGQPAVGATPSPVPVSGSRRGGVREDDVSRRVRAQGPVRQQQVVRRTPRTRWAAATGRRRREGRRRWQGERRRRRASPPHRGPRRRPS